MASLKHLLIAIFFIFAALNLKAGTEIEFCAKVDSVGRCEGKSDQFEWTGDKNKVEVIVRDKNMLHSTKLQFRVYFMKNDNEGELAAELSIYTRPDWKSAERSIYFFKPGYYKVSVFNDKNQLLTSGFLTISGR